MAVDKPAGVILAGGRSRRMGVERKALQTLGGRSLLAHVCDRIQTQVNPLLLSCDAVTDDFDEFDLELVPDLLPGFRGPLTGLYSALQYLADIRQDNGLLLCPCDAPFIPEALAQTLCDANQDEVKPVVVVSWQGVLQPTFSLWQNHHLPAVKAAMVNKGIGGLKRVLLTLPHEVVEWPVSDPSPFFNVNTPAELEKAASWLDRMNA